ncbi:MAG: glycosyltransferase [Patescibacteria group bacterium]
MLVGIPSLNEADNITFVTRQIDRGLQKYFPNYRAVIVNADNFSSDGTVKKFLATKTKTAKIYISTPQGITGKGFNLFNIFRKAIECKSKAVAVFDADLKSIRPEWVRDMLAPILENNFDYCTPIYSRCEYDGSITNHICYPLIFGLFGCEIRQPIGGDFALSRKNVKYVLAQKWHKSTFKYGVDIFLTLSALRGNLKIAEVDLGTKIHKPSAPKLGAMFSQVIMTLFKNIRANKKSWLRIRRTQKLPLFGGGEFEPTQTLEIDYKGMKASALFNFRSNAETLAKFLSPPTFAKLEEMFSRGKIKIGQKLWCEIIFDAVHAFDRLYSNGEIVEALKPLFFGRFLYFFRETLEKNSADCEREIQNQAKFFWRHRRYLLQKYKK